MAKTLDLIGISRRDLLKEIIFGNYKNINHFCNETGEDYGAIYRYLNNDVKIGDKVVRRLEKLLNKPEGFFDQKRPQLDMFTIPVVPNVIEDKNITFEDLIKNSSPSEPFSEKRFHGLNWKKENFFMVKSKDESMYPIIPDDADVVADISKTQIEDNKIYIVKVNNTIMIRRILQSATTGLISLIPENSKFPTETVDSTSNFSILGKMIFLMAAFK
jgi:hypothetical protein